MPIAATLKLVEALMAANRDFEYFPLANHDHSLGRRPAGPTGSWPGASRCELHATAFRSCFSLRFFTVLIAYFLVFRAALTELLRPKTCSAGGTTTSSGTCRG